MEHMLADIPRWHTAIAEWGAALVYISLMRPRRTGRRHYAFAASALVAFLLLQQFAGALPILLWTVGMVAAMMLMFGFIHICVGGNVRDSAYLTARAFVLAELVASLQWQLWVHWQPDAGVPPMGSWHMLLSLLLLVVVFGGSFYAVRQMESRNFTPDRRLDIETQPLITAIAIAAVTFLVSNLSFISPAGPFSGSTSLDIFYIRTLVDLAGFVALYTHHTHRNQVRDATDLAKTQLVMKAQHDQYLQSKRNIEELNRMHHDLKYYIAAIRDEASAERRSEYLHQLADSIRGYESEILTGNYTLDVILSSRMERCLQLGIQLTTIIDGKALEFMEPAPLSSLFGNALDNAIEASEKLPDPDQRIIKVTVFRQKGFALVQIENYWPTDVQLIDGIPQTTKSDRLRHGYGTRNMRRVVESHGGTITFGVEKDWFIVRVLLPTDHR